MDEEERLQQIAEGDGWMLGDMTVEDEPGVSFPVLVNAGLEVCIELSELHALFHYFKRYPKTYDRLLEKAIALTLSDDKKPVLKA